MLMTNNVLRFLHSNITVLLISQPNAYCAVLYSDGICGAELVLKMAHNSFSRVNRGVCSVSAFLIL